jgi:Fe-S oxidoreductase
MTPFRDNFWNVPRWAELLLYVSQGVGIAILTARLYLRAHLWLKGQGGLPTDRAGQRLGRLFKYALAQVRIARERYAGIMHFSLFFAFIVLFLGTALATIDYDVGELIFNVKLLQGDFYLVYELVLDFFAVVGIAGLVMALLRRITPRPARLTYNFAFSATLWILLLDLLSGLLLESLRLAAVQPPWGAWSFAGYALSRGLLALRPTPAALSTAHLATWVFHFSLTGLIYVVFLDLPLKHVIYSPLNVYFSSFREAGVLAALDLEDESIESFGAGQITDLSAMQLMDGDACTECGRCQAACPAFMAGTPLNPRQIVLDIKAGLDRYAPRLQEGGSDRNMPLVREIVSPDALWACTTCYACVWECPVLIEQVDSIVDMRRHLVLMEGDLPAQLATAMSQAERAGNPWGHPKGSRMDWAAGLDVPVLAGKKKADVLYWVGCAGAYDPNSQQTARAMVKIFEAANVDYAVLGEEERCNCEWARRVGNEYLYQEAAHSNIAVLDRYEFETVVTHCPHCFNTFKNEYPQFGGDYDVEHHSTYIARLIGDGYLTPDLPLERVVTFHDSCYLGRCNGLYDDPRAALSAVEGLSLVEMPRSREKGLCCGGGGAQVWFETHQEVPVGQIRLAEALDTNAQTIAASCPFCTLMLTSAAQSTGADEVSIQDIALIVAESLG